MYKIDFKIKNLLDKYMLSQRKVALKCNIRPDTIKMYYDNTIKRLNVEDLENLFTFFHNLDDRITLNDLMEIKKSKIKDYEVL